MDMQYNLCVYNLKYKNNSNKLHILNKLNKLIE